MHDELLETHIIGDGAEQWIVRSDACSPRSMIGAIGSIMAKSESEPFQTAIMELVHSLAVGAEAVHCALLVGLIERYVDHFAERWQDDKRNRAPWKTVWRDFARGWTLKKLAALSAMSAEHLRQRLLVAADCAHSRDGYIKERA